MAYKITKFQWERLKTILMDTLVVFVLLMRTEIISLSKNKFTPLMVTAVIWCVFNFSWRVSWHAFSDVVLI